MRSLKAQGFEESNSKTKLVYDFKKEEAESKRPLMLSSPTRSAAEPRSTSPFKPHPLQFVSPQVMAASASPKRAASPVKSRPASPYKPVTDPMQFISSPSRSRSPVKARPASPVKPRPASPYKPVTDPMQFICSPSRARSPAKPAIPPKPARTWATVEDTPEPSWRTEAKIEVTPAQPKKPVETPKTSEMTDTASRRSMSQKRSMFEGTKEDDSVSGVDPSMLTMAQRRALFEKNRTAPKPVTRFGDAVTPSMLVR